MSSTEIFTQHAKCQWVIARAITYEIISYTQSDQSLHCPHELSLHHWQSRIRPVKILIRLL